jgi:hypothetical protein
VVVQWKAGEAELGAKRQAVSHSASLPRLPPPLAHQPATSRGAADQWWLDWTVDWLAGCILPSGYSHVHEYTDAACIIMATAVSAYMDWWLYMVHGTWSVATCTMYNVQPGSQAATQAAKQAATCSTSKLLHYI